MGPPALCSMPTLNSTTSRVPRQVLDLQKGHWTYQPQRILQHETSRRKKRLLALHAIRPLPNLLLLAKRLLSLLAKRPIQGTGQCRYRFLRRLAPRRPPHPRPLE